LAAAAAALDRLQGTLLDSLTITNFDKERTAIIKISLGNSYLFNYYIINLIFAKWPVISFIFACFQVLFNNFKTTKFSPCIGLDYLVFEMSKTNLL